MDFCKPVVTGFTVTGRRSRHEDTLRLRYAACPDHDTIAISAASLGDFSKHEYATQDYLRPGHQAGPDRVATNDPAARIAFMLDLLNAGNARSRALNAGVVLSADQTASVAAGRTGATPKAARAASNRELP